MQPREQAISLVGADIYEKLIKGYTEKQWGRPCEELPAFIIKRLENMLQSIDVRLNTDYFAHRVELNALAEHVLFTGPIDAYFDYRYGAL